MGDHEDEKKLERNLLLIEDAAGNSVMHLISMKKRLTMMKMVLT